MMPQRLRIMAIGVPCTAVLLVILIDRLVRGDGFGRDAGVYAYTGWRLLLGEIPYRDIWDHKPPLIYFLNAIGILISGRTIWGIVLLEALALLAAALIAYRLVERTSGTAAAVATTILWLTSLAITGTTGSVELFALPLQFGALWLALPSDRLSLQGLLLGISLGTAGLLKPNLFGMWLVVVLWLLFCAHKQGRLLRTLGAFALGVSIPLSMMLGFFAAHQALPQFFDAVVIYNAAYTMVPFSDRLWAGANGVVIYLPTLLPITTLAGLWLIFQRPDRPLLPRLAALALIPEILMTAITGHALRQYYIAWLPACTIVSSVSMAALINWLRQRQQSTSQRSTTLSRVVLGSVLLTLIGIFSVLAYGTLSYREQTPISAREAIVPYIEQHTRADDTVLIWGAETYVNLLTGRPAPTRFVYQYPLFKQGYQRPELSAELLSDLQLRPPRFIIDATNSDGLRSVAPISPLARTQWKSPAAGYQIPADLEPVYNEMLSHYRIVATLGWEEWSVYERH